MSCKKTSIAKFITDLDNAYNGPTIIVNKIDNNEYKIKYTDWFFDIDESTVNIKKEENFKRTHSFSLTVTEINDLPLFISSSIKEIIKTPKHFPIIKDTLRTITIEGKVYRIMDVGDGRFGLLLKV